MIVVARDGTGDFSTIQAAVDAAPTGGRAPVLIFVHRGEYHEKLHITKDNLRIVGEDAGGTVLWNSDYARQTYPDGTEKGTFLSYTLIVTGNHVQLENMTIRNDAGQGGVVGQAVAVYAAGDRLVFRNCRLIAHQDTLFCGPTMQKVCDNALPHILPLQSGSVGDAGVSSNRQYYENCFIQGDVDFIFGPYRCWFENCTLSCNDRGQAVNGYYTAANTPKEQPYGFVFHHCHLTGNCQDSTVYLGRPWRAFARTVFLYCRMDACIKPEGFCDWAEKPVTWRYAEYGTTGARADTAPRHTGATILTEAEAEGITLLEVLAGPDGWNPQRHVPSIYICGDSTACDYTQDRYPRTGWGQALPAQLPGLFVHNEAASGRSSKSFYDENRLCSMRHFLRPGDMLLIQFGHNDEKQDPARETEPRTTFLMHMQMYIDAARAIGALPVLLTPIVRRHFDETGKLMDTHGDYAAAIRDLAEKQGVTLIDMEALTREVVSAMGPEQSKKLYLWVDEGHRNYPQGEKDDTHLCFDGAWAFAGLVSKSVRAMPSAAASALTGHARA